MKSWSLAGLFVLVFGITLVSTGSSETCAQTRDRCRPFGQATVVACGMSMGGTRMATVSDCIRVFGGNDRGWCCSGNTCTDPCAPTYPSPRGPCNPRDFQSVTSQADGIFGAPGTPPGTTSGVRGRVTYLDRNRTRPLPHSRVIIGTGFNYRGPSEVAVHYLQYRTVVADTRANDQGRFAVAIPPGRYDIFIWRECYVPQIYRNVQLPTNTNINAQLTRGQSVLGSHCPAIRFLRSR